MLRALDRLVEAAIGAIALALIVTAFGQVLARYLFSRPFGWVLEVDVLLMVWLTMLSGYLGVRRRSHMATDFLVARLPEPRRGQVAIAVQLLCGLLVALIGWNSFAIVEAMQGMRFVSIELDQSALYWSLPIGMGLMLLAIAVDLSARVRAALQ
ncbi:MAG: TRAP transporter small permease [Burkholderiales bacterium]|nr:MAG: TRAP transporter small permease [Burkholderiales bacterium]